jgi:hypothetical protein
MDLAQCEEGGADMGISWVKKIFGTTGTDPTT